ncbi:piggyBac transposable element-derived protein 4-like [Cheilinus undulatus]|uniref:piggyBac transposable element-derived protein 4-like n=1 Tax=Cheilinus undulatus TaxID=241271 RepID=UPI001BD330D6|nr:piggyBac transposable element-derived protein 4-like [Cheilinus undulatus]
MIQSCRRRINNNKRQTHHSVCSLNMDEREEIVPVKRVVTQGNLLNEENPPTSSSDGSPSDDDDEVEDETFVPGPEGTSEEEGEGMDVDEDVNEGGDKPCTAWLSKSGITWSPTEEETLRYRAAGIRKPGITRYAASHINDLEDSFSFFITEEIIDTIVRQTNVQGGRKAGDGWKEVDRVEMRAYLGLLLLAGVHRSRGEATCSLWGEDTGRPIFRATMSLKRFITLSRMIRFDDRLTRQAQKKPDKLAPIRDVWDQWVVRLPLAFNPGENICIDEQLVGFRGRCRFKQYIPSKPAKYGLKLWALCDVATSYAWGLQPYLGKPTREAPPEGEQGKRVVLELTEGLSGHTVTTDNFFTSYDLGMKLLERKMALVGTVRHNKPELPPQLLKVKERQVLSSLFAFTSKMTAVSYVPKRSRNVLLLSTKHRSAEVSGEQHQKPQIILDYNRCKGAVDNLDKLVALYSSRRMTRRWPMVLFGNMLDVSAYNALVLWLEVNPEWNRGKNFRRRLFLQELGNCLVRPAMARRKRLPRTPNTAAMVEAAQRAADQSPSKAEEPRAKRKCRLCHGKRSVFSRSCSKCGHAVCKDHTVWICSACTN